MMVELARKCQALPLYAVPCVLLLYECACMRVQLRFYALPCS